jgi:predicted RNA methylase
MPTTFPPCVNRWKILYRAAILKTNKGLLPQRVAEAEEAVKARGREVFYDNGAPEEKEAEALEKALYTLRAFRTAWQHREAA